MNTNQNDKRNQENDGASQGKTNMDLDKTPGRVEDANDKNRDREQNASTSDREGHNRNNDNRNNDNRNNDNRDDENRNQENADQDENDDREDDR